jgi:hypothetical protein
MGLVLVRDYGLHIDEYHNQDFGKKWAQVLKDPSKGKAIKINPHDRVHGPFFEVVLTCITDALKLHAPYDVIRIRHLGTFLSFCFGAALFYMICTSFFGSWLWGLIASLIFVLHPRIFADSFYNSVDIPFLVFYIASFGTLILFLCRLNGWSAALHAMVCAISMDIRLVGVIMPILTIILVFQMKQQKQLEAFKAGQVMMTLIFFICLLGGFVVLFSPMLWHDPVGRFWNMFRDTAQFEFLGMSVPPWHYTLRWIFVTTPISICVFFVIGVGVAFKKFQRGELLQEKQIILSALILFFVPVLAPAFFKTVLFDGWRHHYFVYPFFVLFATIGVQFCWNQKSLRLLSAAFLIFSLLQTGWFMIQFHPHQSIYANVLAGANLHRVKDYGALDYWGLSYRQGIEHILRTDTRDKIKISADIFFQKRNLGILPPQDRQRIVFVARHRWEEADYFVTNFKRIFGPVRNLFT